MLLEAAQSFKLSIPITPVTCYYRWLHPHCCTFSAFLKPPYLHFCFLACLPLLRFPSHTLLSALPLPGPCSLTAHLLPSCSAQLSKIFPFILSQEASATSSPLTTPVSRWHSVILFFSSHSMLLFPPEMQRTGNCVCLGVCECVRGLEQTYSKEEREQNRPTVCKSKFLTTLFDSDYLSHTVTKESWPGCLNSQP